MPQVFMGDDLAISIDVGRDVTDATEQVILYKKPNSVTGSWAASKSGTTVTFNATSGEIDMPGLWQFEARVTIDSKKQTSPIVTQMIEKPLDA